MFLKVQTTYVSCDCWCSVKALSIDIGTDSPEAYSIHFFQTGDGGTGSAALVFFDASMTVSETVTPVMLCVQLDLAPGTISLGCDMTVTLGVSDGTAGTYICHS